ncbi:hypothetical protein TNCV_997871 [Trichonephila clavipes]|nr:hypothetical protein TNCV_997871 [Trichonephila clavipes]
MCIWFHLFGPQKQHFRDKQYADEVDVQHEVLLRMTQYYPQEFRASGIGALIKQWNKFWRCRNCGGGDRGRVAIYRPFGELRRAKIVLSPVWCSRPTTGVPLAHATMNFVGLDLTASDRWHQTTTTTTSSHYNFVSYRASI